MGNMRIKAEHVAGLARIIPDDATDLAQAWKALHSNWIDSWPVIREIYRYANDTHIDTALKHIIRTRDCL